MISIMPVDIQHLADSYLSDSRGHAHGSPWVMLNMITSLDGATAVDGVSGRLGNEVDVAVFKTLRSLADVIIVTSATARSENYKVPSISDRFAEQRKQRGQTERPVIAVATRTLSIDLEAPIFSLPGYRPVIITVDDAPTKVLNDIKDVADIITAGNGEIDLDSAINQLSSRYGPTVLVEGGPTLNGLLACADLIDELCLTVSPLLVGGASERLLSNGPEHEPRPFSLERHMNAGELLFTRYLRNR